MEYKFCPKHSVLWLGILHFCLHWWMCICKSTLFYILTNTPPYITVSVSPQNTVLHCSLGPAFHGSQTQDIYSLDTITALPLQYSLSTSPLAKLSENLLSKVSIILLEACKLFCTSILT